MCALVRQLCGADSPIDPQEVLSVRPSMHTRPVGTQPHSNPRAMHRRKRARPI